MCEHGDSVAEDRGCAVMSMRGLRRHCGEGSPAGPCGAGGFSGQLSTGCVGVGVGRKWGGVVAPAQR